MDPRKIIFLLVTTMSILACTIATTPPLATPTSPLAASPATRPALATATPTPLATATTQTFVVAAASVYTRDTGNGKITGFVIDGQTIACVPMDQGPQAGWCIMDQDTKVWAGCLTPNILNKECRSRGSR